jgi:hypothetical protein
LDLGLEELLFELPLLRLEDKLFGLHRSSVVWAPQGRVNGPIPESLQNSKARKLFLAAHVGPAFLDAESFGQLSIEVFARFDREHPGMERREGDGEELYRVALVGLRDRSELPVLRFGPRTQIGAVCLADGIGMFFL